ncbi:Transcriptional regulator, MerR family [Candidatus Syntrophocurvum alkaliphilum]|uniref:Transcriptional regulator, MerR family n=1 Tax=Candidatus Syntrophocurvum alkaliphilum TaxID=2293317 RepID=A0A6I6DHZ8_9FIRM|nr:MerR family transcriptional regulator [Candidatus Syntrophocurvum alkaliphilum]QGT99940.1 Transcriptional regulator, MerR family [Candidatus Syntrophocurvum alkaliphilum]
MREIRYKISEVSDLLGIEQHTLRYLENSLKLKIKRDERGDRVYNDSDLETFRLILSLRDKGLNTTAIKMALENLNQSDETSVAPKTSTNNNIEIYEAIANIEKIVEQNDKLIKQNENLEKRIENLEKKIDEKESNRQSKIDELIRLWKAEQEKNKSWLSKLRGR